MTSFARILVPALAALATGAAAEPYRLGPGDVLTVSTLGHPDLTGPVRVRDSGDIALHMIGRVNVAGMTVVETEEALDAKISEAFQTDASVIVEINTYRDVYILGDVDAPGAYPYHPGMTVLKALAIAGGLRRGPELASSGDQWRIEDARRRAVQARARIDALTEEVAAIDGELSRLGVDAGAALAPEDSTESAVASGARGTLIALRVAALDRSVERAERQARLAAEEAKSFEERREIIGRQLSATEEQLNNIQSLIDRGLARRESVLDLQVEADDFRADVLEAAAFEARARQTAANADSEIAILETRHRQELLADRVEAAERLALEEADYRANLAFLRDFGGATLPLSTNGEAAPSFEIQREGEAKPVSPAAALAPDDVLVVRVETLTQ